ncbi:MAG: hypothetical protein WCV68_03140 [Candidatus Paceibacterota bacterium]|jgi:hypothetical protein
MIKLINLTDLAKKTWALYVAKFNILVGLMALPFVLFIISPLLAQTEDFLYLPFSLLLMVVAFVAMLWGGTATVIVLDRREENLTIKEALTLSQGKLWPVVWVAIIVCFIVGGASMLFIIPGLILAFYFLFAKIIVITEEETGMKALVKSREYLRGYFWPIVGRYLAIVIISTLILAIFNSVASVVTQSTSSFLNSVGREALLLVLQTFINIVIFPLMIIPAYLLYDNVREVKSDLNFVPSTGLTYLWIGLAGWVFLGVLIVLAIVVFTTAIGGFLLGAFATDIFNSQALLK